MDRQSETVLSWTVGAVKITRILELEIPIGHDPARPFLAEATPAALRAIPWLYPDYVDEHDRLRISIHALLVEAPGVRLVVDTCIGNDRPREFIGNQPLATDFLARFTSAGWTREGVDAVVCTHLHVDHVGWNTMRDGDRWVPTFPNARYLIGREELEYWSAVPHAETQTILADSITPILDAGLVQLVETDHVISPEIQLVPTPGHTPGHVSVLIESNGESAVITGDLTHHPCQMSHPEWSPPFDSDTKASTVTRRKMFAAWADKPILVIGTHYAAPTAGHVKSQGEVFRFEGWAAVATTTRDSRS